MIVANQMAKRVSMLAKELLFTKLKVGETLPRLDQGFTRHSTRRCEAASVAMTHFSPDAGLPTRGSAALYRRSWRLWERNWQPRSIRNTVVTTSAATCGGRECVWIQLMAKKKILCLVATSLTRTRRSWSRSSVKRGP